MSERFYLSSQFEAGQTQILAGPEAHHLINVMRAKPGDPLQVFDGRGNQADAVIRASNRREVEIELQHCQAIDRRPQARILIAAAVPKGERLRFMVEKLTELGAYAWLPLQAQRSVNPLNPSTEKKIHQWIVDACKQSERNHLLECLPPLSVATMLKQFHAVPEKRIAAAPKDSLLSPTPLSEVTSVSNITANDENANLPFDQVILIGPEGGFTTEEVGLAIEHGYQPLQLGSLVLRIETAAVAALTQSLFCR